MLLRTLVEQNRPKQEGERYLTDREARIIYTGRYWFSRGVTGIRYVPCNVPEIAANYASDRVPKQRQVLRESFMGEDHPTNPPEYTTRPDHETTDRLNSPRVLLRASNTEKIARRIKRGASIAAVGVACTVAIASRAYKSREV